MRKYVFTDEETEFIRSSYYTNTSGEVAKTLNVPVHAITNEWARQGLSGKPRRVYTLDETYFDVIDTEPKAYMAGFIAADGCIYVAKKENQRKQGIIRISINRKDIELLELFKVELRCNKPISLSYGRYCSLELVSDKLVEALEKIGLSPRKTYGNTIAHIQQHLMQAYLRGYFDGDGSITYKEEKPLTKTSVSIVGYESNMISIQKYLESKNIFSTIVADNREYNGEERFVSLVMTNLISKYAFLRLLCDGDQSLRLSRKREAAVAFCSAVDQLGDPRYKECSVYYENAVRRKIYGRITN